MPDDPPTVSAKHEPDLDVAIPPPQPSASSHRVKPEPSSGHAIPLPKAEPKSEDGDVKPDVRPRAHKRVRASRSASPLAGAPDGWVEDPDEVARRAAQREGDRERREERKAMGIKPRKRTKRAVKDEDDVKVKREPSLYNLYMKEKMALPQTDDPPLLHKERFKRVAESWKFSLKNPNNVVRPWSRYGPPAVDGDENAAAGPSGVIVLDESDDDEVQVIERPDPERDGRVDAAKKEEVMDDDDVGPRPGPSVKGEEDALAEIKHHEDESPLEITAPAPTDPPPPGDSAVQAHASADLSKMEPGETPITSTSHQDDVVRDSDDTKPSPA